MRNWNTAHAPYHHGDTRAGYLSRQAEPGKLVCNTYHVLQHNFYKQGHPRSAPVTSPRVLLVYFLAQRQFSTKNSVFHFFMESSGSDMRGSVAASPQIGCGGAQLLA